MYCFTLPAADLNSILGSASGPKMQFPRFYPWMVLSKELLYMSSKLIHSHIDSRSELEIDPNDIFFSFTELGTSCELSRHNPFCKTS